MNLQDLEFIIPMYERVKIIEYSRYNKFPKKVYDEKEWYMVNGLNREVISISSSEWVLFIEVYE